jgi:hypothetical protein
VEPHDIGKLIQGIQINVYQAKSYPNKPGKWHAHVSGGHLTKEEIEIAIEIAGEHGVYDESKDEWWIDAGSHSDSELEARERACAFIGSIFGQRLAKTLGPQTIPAETIAPKQRVKLGC